MENNDLAVRFWTRRNDNRTATPEASDTQISDELFVDLIKGYETRLYRIAFMYFRNEHDALEMVSETVFRAYKNKRQLKTSGYFRTWVTRILINTCLNCIKRRKLTCSADERFLETTGGAPHGDAELSIILSEGISRLKPEYKTVLLLRFYQEMSVKETAAVMGKQENTVKTITRRALIELKNLIGEDILHE